MTITKIFCDVCKKEVDTYGDLEEINLDTKSGMKRRYAVCSECYVNICSYIRNLSEKTEMPNEKYIKKTYFSNIKNILKK